MISLRVLALLPALLGSALADCECGYSVAASDQTYTFTDLLETDFIHVDLKQEGLEYGAFGWAPQQFNLSSTEARGRYGEMFIVDNVLSNNIADPNVWEGNGQDGGVAGLQLLVDSKPIDNMVPVSEIATPSLDFAYGTYRASLMITDVPGTCTAFFWYFNDTQEIDLEFLSAEFDAENGTFPVNLVLQSKESAQAGNDASETKNFKIVNLPFNPTEALHEYRFDFVPGKVTFYADGQVLAEMAGDAVPTTSGNLLLSHWSNGNEGWSRGPPVREAITTVSYIKAYFNSSLEQRQTDFATRCTDPTAPNAVCGIPEGDPTYFFTLQDNMTVGQTTYGVHGEDNASTHIKPGFTVLLVATLASVALAVGV